MDTGAWWAAVHGVAKSPAQLSDYQLLKYIFYYNVSLKYNLQCCLKCIFISMPIMISIIS